MFAQVTVMLVAVVSTVASQQGSPGFDSQVRAFLWGVCMFSLCGFSPGTLASSPSPITCRLGVRLTGHS